MGSPFPRFSFRKSSNTWGHSAVSSSMALCSPVARAITSCGILLTTVESSSGSMGCGALGCGALGRPGFGGSGRRGGGFGASALGALSDIMSIDADGASPGKENALIDGCCGMGPRTLSRSAALRVPPPLTAIFSTPSLMSAAIFRYTEKNLLGAIVSTSPLAKRAASLRKVARGRVCSNSENRRPSSATPTPRPMTTG